MDPILDYHVVPDPGDENKGRDVLGKAARFSKAGYFLNFFLCAVFGMFAVGDPTLLPYFLMLTLLTTGNVLYQQFLRPRSQERFEAKLYRRSALMRLPCRVRLYSDRVEMETLGGPESPEMVLCYPLTMVNQVIENPEAFYLLFSVERIIPIRKKECSLAEQNMLRTLFSRVCCNYMEQKSV